MAVVQNVGILGTSGMAREAGDIARALGYEPIFVAKDEVEIYNWTYSGKVILEYDIERYAGIPYVIGIGDGRVRKNVAKRFRNRLKFTNLIHPSATFGTFQREALNSCKGLIIAAGARFTTGISVGDFCIFNQNMTIAHDCVVGSFVHVASGANISGNVHLGDGCWIGAGSVVNQGKEFKKLKIGSNTLVGSGAVVVADCMSNAVYAGAPAKRIK